ALEHHQPHLLALLESGIEPAHALDLGAPDLLDDVARLEADARRLRVGPHLQNDHALLVLDAQLVGDARQDVADARAVEGVRTRQIAYVVLASLRGRAQRHIDRELAALAHDV